MEQVSKAKFRTVKNATTSLEYSQILSIQREQLVQDNVRAAIGCLLREECLGFSSLTPTECPVKECSARFNRSNLSVQNVNTCIDPLNNSQQNIK